MGEFINHQITARRLKFDFSQTPVHWIEGDAYATHVMNVLNIAITQIEHWFCRLANQTLQHVSDPNLIADIKGFIAQEGAHAMAHQGAEQYFHKHDIDIQDYKKFLDWAFKDILSDQPLGITLPTAQLQKLWLAYRMGMIAVWEHYFCSFGTWVLDADGLDNADPVMLDILRWHGAEEVEHRTVAYDAFRGLVGDGLSAYVLRQSSAAIAFPVMAIGWLGTASYLCHIDPHANAKKYAFKNPIRALKQFHQSSKQNRVPSLSMIFKSLKHWSTLSYHPEHDGDVKKALAYLEKSNAARIAQAG